MLRCWRRPLASSAMSIPSAVAACSERWATQRQFHRLASPSLGDELADRDGEGVDGRLEPGPGRGSPGRDDPGDEFRPFTTTSASMRPFDALRSASTARPAMVAPAGSTIDTAGPSWIGRPGREDPLQPLPVQRRGRRSTSSGTVGPVRRPPAPWRDRDRTG